jgi:hypothetical protein
MKNLHPADRFLRAMLGIALLELGYFWIAGPWQWVAYAAAAVMLITAAVRFCPLYRLLGISTAGRSKGSLRIGGWVLATGALAALLVGGSYASAFFTRKIFLEDFNALNHFYKQALYLTGKNERGPATVNYDQLTPALAAFQNKYTRYQPYALKGDRQLAVDLQSVSTMVANVAPLVRTGDLHQAHLDLEKVRPVFQEIFKRNGFSMVAVALVDFHDAMERMLDAANAKDGRQIVSLYPSVSDKLKTVEAEINDAEIQAIRKNLDGLKNVAESQKPDALPAQGDALKTSFVKVYLKRG